MKTHPGRVLFRRARACGLLLALAAPLAGRPPPPLDPALPPYQPAGALTGALTVSRVASMAGIVERWAAGFSRCHPGVRVGQTQKDNANDLMNVFRELADGRAQVAPFPRDLQPPELAAVAGLLGSEPLSVTVATGSYDTPSNGAAVAIIANAANPLPGLSLQQLDAVLSAERRRGGAEAITRWGRLGLTGEWADRPIRIYGMATNNQAGLPHGIVFYLMRRVLLGAAFRPGVIQVPDTGIGRGNNRAFEDVVRRVAADPGAIGYAGFSDLRPGVRALALSEGPAGPYCQGTYENVLSRAYPLIRDMAVRVRAAPGAPLDPLAREFLRYALSREGQQAVAADPANLLPLPSCVAAAEREKLR